jgi:hypothetical protein
MPSQLGVDLSGYSNLWFRCFCFISVRGVLVGVLRFVTSVFLFTLIWWCTRRGVQIRDFGVFCSPFAGNILYGIRGSFGCTSVGGVLATVKEEDNRHLNQYTKHANRVPKLISDRFVNILHFRQNRSVSALSLFPGGVGSSPSRGCSTGH